MPHVLIIHEVEAYAAWKRVFDQAAAMRKAAGELSYQLLRYDTDANAVVYFSAWFRRGAFSNRLRWSKFAGRPGSKHPNSSICTKSNVACCSR